MKEQDSIRKLKGVGEKTEALFQKIGIRTIGDLLHDYPRNYDIYEEAVSIGELQGQEKAAITATITGTVDVKKVKNLTIISTVVADVTGTCRLTWFNMPFLRNTLKRGMAFVFRGKVSDKKGQILLEQPEIFTPAAYEHKATLCINCSKLVNFTEFFKTKNHFYSFVGCVATAISDGNRHINIF